MTRVRSLLAGLTLILPLALAPGAAQAQTPTTVLSGSTNPRSTPGVLAWCSVDLGPATFQRAGSGPAKISLKAVNYTVPQGNNLPFYYEMAGQTLMTFATPTTGTLAFPYRAGYPAGVRAPKFRNYSQTYTGETRILTVSFVLELPNCALPILSSFRN
jgi:hypothetical protein